MLLDPKQIHQVLKDEGALTGKNFKPAQGSESKARLSKLLEDNNLTAEEVLDNLSSMMRSAESDSTRLRAAEIGLKLNGLLDNDNDKLNFNVVINIVDSEFCAPVNPILVPR